MDITVRVPTRIRIPLKPRDVKRSAILMLKEAGVKRAELSIVFLEATSMRLLNRKYLGHDYVTDVISFDLNDRASARASINGEIFICPAEAGRNAKLYDEPLERELLRYLAHGILHLKGLDDATAAGRMRMRKLEDKLLAASGR